MSWAGVLSILFFLTSSVLGIVVYRLSRRLLQFDELIEMLSHDIEVNGRYFAKLLSTPTFSNSQEVMTANRNMSIIAKRLEEYALQMEDVTGKQLIQREQSVKSPVIR